MPFVIENHARSEISCGVVETDVDDSINRMEPVVAMYDSFVPWLAPNLMNEVANDEKQKRPKTTNSEAVNSEKQSWFTRWFSRPVKAEDIRESAEVTEETESLEPTVEPTIHRFDGCEFPQEAHSLARFHMASLASKFNIGRISNSKTLIGSASFKLGVVVDFHIDTIGKKSLYHISAMTTSDRNLLENIAQKESKSNNYVQLPRHSSHVRVAALGEHCRCVSWGFDSGLVIIYRRDDKVWTAVAIVESSAAIEDISMEGRQRLQCPSLHKVSDLCPLWISNTMSCLIIGRIGGVFDLVAISSSLWDNPKHKVQSKIIHLPSTSISTRPYHLDVTCVDAQVRNDGILIVASGALASSPYTPAISMWHADLAKKTNVTFLDCYECFKEKECLCSIPASSFWLRRYLFGHLRLDNVEISKFCEKQSLDPLICFSAPLARLRLRPVDQQVIALLDFYGSASLIRLHDKRILGINEISTNQRYTCISWMNLPFDGFHLACSSANGEISVVRLKLPTSKGLIRAKAIVRYDSGHDLNSSMTLCDPLSLSQHLCFVKYENMLSSDSFQVASISFSDNKEDLMKQSVQIHKPHKRPHTSSGGETDTNFAQSAMLQALALPGSPMSLAQESCDPSFLARIPDDDFVISCALYEYANVDSFEVLHSIIKEGFSRTTQLLGQRIRTNHHYDAEYERKLQLNSTLLRKRLHNLVTFTWLCRHENVPFRSNVFFHIFLSNSILDVVKSYARVGDIVAVVLLLSRHDDGDIPDRLEVLNNLPIGVTSTAFEMVLHSVVSSVGSGTFDGASFSTTDLGEQIYFRRFHTLEQHGFNFLPELNSFLAKKDLSIFKLRSDSPPSQLFLSLMHYIYFVEGGIFNESFSFEKWINLSVQRGVEFALSYAVNGADAVARWNRFLFPMLVGKHALPSDAQIWIWQASPTIRTFREAMEDSLVSICLERIKINGAKYLNICIAFAKLSRASLPRNVRIIQSDRTMYRFVSDSIRLTTFPNDSRFRETLDSFWTLFECLPKRSLNDESNELAHLADRLKRHLFLVELCSSYRPPPTFETITSCASGFRLVECIFDLMCASFVGSKGTKSLNSFLLDSVTFLKVSGPPFVCLLEDVLFLHLLEQKCFQTTKATVAALKALHERGTTFLMEGVANTIDTFIHSLTGSEDVEALHFCTSLLENFPDLNKGKLYDKTKQKNLLAVVCEGMKMKTINIDDYGKFSAVDVLEHNLEENALYLRERWNVSIIEDKRNQSYWKAKPSFLYLPFLLVQNDKDYQIHMNGMLLRFMNKLELYEQAGPFISLFLRYISKLKGLDNPEVIERCLEATRHITLIVSQDSYHDLDARRTICAQCVNHLSTLLSQFSSVSTESLALIEEELFALASLLCKLTDSFNNLDAAQSVPEANTRGNADKTDLATNGICRLNMFAKHGHNGFDIESRDSSKCAERDSTLSLFRAQKATTPISAGLEAGTENLTVVNSSNGWLFDEDEFMEHEINGESYASQNFQKLSSVENDPKSCRSKIEGIKTKTVSERSHIKVPKMTQDKHMVSRKLNVNTDTVPKAPDTSDIQNVVYDKPQEVPNAIGSLNSSGVHNKAQDNHVQQENMLITSIADVRDSNDLQAVGDADTKQAEDTRSLSLAESNVFGKVNYNEAHYDLRAHGRSSMDLDSGDKLSQDHNNFVESTSQNPDDLFEYAVQAVQSNDWEFDDDEIFDEQTIGHGLPIQPYSPDNNAKSKDTDLGGVQKLALPTSSPMNIGLETSDNHPLSVESNFDSDTCPNAQHMQSSNKRPNVADDKASVESRDIIEKKEIETLNAEIQIPKKREFLENLRTVSKTDISVSEDLQADENLITRKAQGTLGWEDSILLQIEISSGDFENVASDELRYVENTSLENSGEAPSNLLESGTENSGTLSEKVVQAVQSNTWAFDDDEIFAVETNGEGLPPPISALVANHTTSDAKNSNDLYKLTVSEVLPINMPVERSDNHPLIEKSNVGSDPSLKAPDNNRPNVAYNKVPQETKDINQTNDIEVLNSTEVEFKVREKRDFLERFNSVSKTDITQSEDYITDENLKTTRVEDIRELEDSIASSTIISSGNNYTLASNKLQDVGNTSNSDEVSSEVTVKQDGSSVIASKSNGWAFDDEEILDNETSEKGLSNPIAFTVSNQTKPAGENSNGSNNLTVAEISPLTTKLKKSVNQPVSVNSNFDSYAFPKAPDLDGKPSVADNKALEETKDIIDSHSTEVESKDLEKRNFNFVSKTHERESQDLQADDNLNAENARNSGELEKSTFSGIVTGNTDNTASDELSDVGNTSLKLSSGCTFLKDHSTVLESGKEDLDLFGEAVQSNDWAFDDEEIFVDETSGRHDLPCPISSSAANHTCSEVTTSTGVKALEASEGSCIQVTHNHPLSANYDVSLSSASDSPTVPRLVDVKSPEESKAIRGEITNDNYRHPQASHADTKELKPSIISEEAVSQIAKDNAVLGTDLTSDDRYSKHRIAALDTGTEKLDDRAVDQSNDWAFDDEEFFDDEKIGKSPPRPISPPAQKNNRSEENPLNGGKEPTGTDSAQIKVPYNPTENSLGSSTFVQHMIRAPEKQAVRKTSPISVEQKRKLAEEGRKLLSMRKVPHQTIDAVKTSIPRPIMHPVKEISNNSPVKDSSSLDLEGEKKRLSVEGRRLMEEKRRSKKS